MLAPCDPCLTDAKVAPRQGVCRKRKGGAQFRANFRLRDTARALIDWTIRFHLALSHSCHSASPTARETHKRKGPDRYRRGPELPRVYRVQSTRILSGPTATPRESAVLMRRGNAQIVDAF
jgi:hypothetical protein